MKSVSAALQAHFGQATTTLAVLWKVTRLDGTVLGFTSFDQNITYQGTTYLASSGFLPSANDNNSDMSVDSLEMAGFLDNVVIKESDIRNGVYDFALVEQRIVNWQDLTQLDLLLRKGIVGNITMKNGLFTAEIRGLTQYLSTYIGQLYGPLCRAELYSTPTNNVSPGDHYFCYVKETDYQQNGTVGTPVDSLHITPGTSFSPSSGSWAFNSSCENGNHSNNVVNSGSTFTIAYSANVHAGDLLLLAVYGNQTNWAITDTQGNSWSQIRGYVNRGDNYFLSLWWAVAGNSAANTVNIKNNSASQETALQMEISCFTPPATVSLDQSATNNSNASGNSSTPSATVGTTYTNELVIGAALPFGFPTGALAGFAGTTSFGSGQQPLVYAVEANAGSYTPGVQMASSNIFAFIAASFKAGSFVGLLQKGSATPTVPAPAGWFNDGELTFTSGANNGFSFEIKTWDGTTLTLFLPLPFPPLAGDTFTIEPGCDKSNTATGCLKFQGYSTDGSQAIVAPTNILNFRGDPFIPGNDLYYQYPDATSGS